MRYALLICQDENTVFNPEERSVRLAAFNAFTDGMDARGILLSGFRLQPTSAATTVKVRDGGVVIADGPFAETKEQIAGFYLVECKGLDEAIEVAANIPSALNGTIEVRPVWEIWPGLRRPSARRFNSSGVGSLLT
jgi:hypothetical protein